MPPENTNTVSTKTPGKGSNLNYEMLKKVPWWVVVAVLVIICALIVVIIRPWQSGGIRTISVTGDATVKAVPDEFVFSPSYNFTNANQQTALNQLTADNQKIDSGLKSLGVPDNDISNNSSGWSNTSSFSATDGTYTYTLDLTITIDNNKTLAQKVQNYLLTTGPSGQVSPEADFSHSQQVALENQARLAAEANARSNALATAKNLGFSLGGVKSVTDNGFGGSSTGCFEGACEATGLNNAAASSTTLKLEPGQDDLDYTVTVVYYIH